MTFYQAALEVLKTHGEPLSALQITEKALEGKLLSHVGRLPEQTMRSRLFAMARAEEGRQVVAVEEGLFGLPEWGLVQSPEFLEVEGEEVDAEGVPLRGNERTPMTLQERRAIEDAERDGSFAEEDESARARGRRRRRRPRMGETPAEALAALIREVGGGPVDFSYIIDAIPRQEGLPEGFPTDLEGLRAIALEENARLDAGGAEVSGQRFEIEGDRVDVCLPELADGPLEEPSEKVKAVSPFLIKHLRRLKPGQLVEAARRALEATGLSGVKVAKQGASGAPLLIASARLGVTRQRVAVRLFAGNQELRPEHVEEIRIDLENYAAAIGAVVTLGKVSREARAAAEDGSDRPVFLFDGEAFAALCVEAGVGTKVELRPTYLFDASGLGA